MRREHDRNDHNLGIHYARERAISQIWGLEAYTLSADFHLAVSV
jgi:hypothetical protein